MARSATIASLSAKLSLNASKFTSGLRRAVGDARRFGTQTDATTQQVRRMQAQLARSRALTQFSAGLTSVRGSMVGLVGRMGALLGVSLSVAGAIAAVSRSMTQLDKIAKTSQRLQVNAESFQRLAHAADLSGLSIESLSNPIRRFMRTMADAQKGAGAGAQMFDSLGLDPKTLGTSDLVEQMAQVGDALLAMNNPAQRVRAAFELMGRSGTDMLPLLLQGGDAIRAMAAEADQLNVVSGEDLAKIEQANDAISRMKKAFQGVSNEIAVALSPMIEVVATETKDWLVGMKTDGDIAGKVVAGMAKAVGFVGDGFRGLHLIWKGFVFAVRVGTVAVANGVQMLLKGIVGGANMAISALNKIPGVDIEPFKQMDMTGFDAFIESLEGEAEEAYNSMVDLFDARLPSQKIEASMQSISDKAGEIAKETADRRNKMAMLSAEDLDLDEMIEDLERMRSEADTIMSSMATPFEEFEKKVANLTKLKDAGVLPQEFFDRALFDAEQKLAKAFGKTTESVFDQADAIGQLVDVQRQLREENEAMSGKAGLMAIGVGGQRGGSISMQEGSMPEQQQSRFNGAVSTSQNQTATSSSANNAIQRLPQLDTTNSILSSIDRKLGMPMVAVAG